MSHTKPNATCVVHGVRQEVRSLGAQAESGHRVTVAVHVVDQLVLPQVPHLHDEWDEKQFSQRTHGEL